MNWRQDERERGAIAQTLSTAEEEDEGSTMLRVFVT
jgi:hypothetical protein